MLRSVPSGGSRKFLGETFKSNSDPAGGYVKAGLRERCLRDLSNGGRGVGNQLETWLINPLDRALFDQEIGEEAEVAVRTIELIESVPTPVRRDDLLHSTLMFSEVSNMEARISQVGASCS